jgi:hypothetical protein
VRHDDLQGTPLHAVVGLGQYKYQEFIPNSPTLASRAMPPETGVEMTEAGTRAPPPRAGPPWWHPAACGTWTPPVATSGGWICKESQGSRAAAHHQRGAPSCASARGPHRRGPRVPDPEKPTIAAASSACSAAAGMYVTEGMEMGHFGLLN